MLILLVKQLIIEQAKIQIQNAINALKLIVQTCNWYQTQTTKFQIITNSGD